jgi:hypothetical protein
MRVTAPLGAEGLTFADGLDILVAGGAESLVARVVSLLEDPQRRRLVGAGARCRVEGRYGMKSLRSALHASLQEVPV